MRSTLERGARHLLGAIPAVLGSAATLAVVALGDGDFSRASADSIGSATFAGEVGSNLSNTPPPSGTTLVNGFGFFTASNTGTDGNVFSQVIIGPDPFVQALLSGSVTQNLVGTAGGGGYNSGGLNYYVQFVGATNTTIPVLVQAYGAAIASAGTNATSTLQIQSGYDQIFFEATTVANIFGYGSSFSVSNTYNLQTNTPYLVTLSASTSASVSPAYGTTDSFFAKAFVDPVFTIDPAFAGTYSLELSPGIQNTLAVPGPVAGAGLPGLIFAGGGLLGWWRRKRKVEAAA